MEKDCGLVEYNRTCVIDRNVVWPPLTSIALRTSVCLLLIPGCEKSPQAVCVMPRSLPFHGLGLGPSSVMAELLGACCASHSKHSAISALAQVSPDHHRCPGEIGLDAVPLWLPQPILGEPALERLHGKNLHPSGIWAL